jgi:hypothetical protein
VIASDATAPRPKRVKRIRLALLVSSFAACLGVTLMGAVFLAIWTGPWRAFRAALAAGDRPQAAAQAAKVRALVHVNLGLGTLTVLVASFGSFAR